MDSLVNKIKSLPTQVTCFPIKVRDFIRREIRPVSSVTLKAVNAVVIAVVTNPGLGHTCYVVGVAVIAVGDKGRHSAFKINFEHWYVKVGSELSGSVTTQECCVCRER